MHHWLWFNMLYVRHPCHCLECWQLWAGKGKRQLYNICANYFQTSTKDDFQAFHGTSCKGLHHYMQSFVIETKFKIYSILKIFREHPARVSSPLLSYSWRQALSTRYLLCSPFLSGLHHHHHHHHHIHVCHHHHYADQVQLEPHWSGHLRNCRTWGFRPMH